MEENVPLYSDEGEFRFIDTTLFCLIILGRYFEILSTPSVAFKCVNGWLTRVNLRRGL